MSTQEIQRIRYSDFILENKGEFQLFLHDPEAAFEVHGDPQPRPGYVPDLDFKLQKFYDHFSAIYVMRTVSEPIPGWEDRTVECCNVNGVGITFNRDQYEGHVKGARFESKSRGSLQGLLDGLFINS